MPDYAGVIEVSGTVDEESGGFGARRSSGIPWPVFQTTGRSCDYPRTPEQGTGFAWDIVAYGGRKSKLLAPGLTDRCPFSAIAQYATWDRLINAFESELYPSLAQKTHKYACSSRGSKKIHPKPEFNSRGGMRNRCGWKTERLRRPTQSQCSRQLPPDPRQKVFD